MFCPLCSMPQFSEDSLMAHIVLNHDELSPWTCKICKKGRLTKKQMNEHFYVEHKNEKRLFVLDVDKEEELERLIEEAKNAKPIVNQETGSFTDEIVSTYSPTFVSQNNSHSPSKYCAARTQSVKSLMADPLWKIKIEETTAENAVITAINNLSDIEETPAVPSKDTDGGSQSNRQFSNDPPTHSYCTRASTSAEFDRLKNVRHRYCRPTNEEMANDETKKFCHICRKYFTRSGGQDLIKHISMHMKEVCLYSRYACTLCEYQASQYNHVRAHSISKHNGANCFYDNIENWKIDDVMTVSMLCFNDEQFLIHEMPRKWQKRNNNRRTLKLMKKTSF